MQFCNKSEAKVRVESVNNSIVFCFFGGFFQNNFFFHQSLYPKSFHKGMILLLVIIHM